jgi:hypothetical protein
MRAPVHGARRPEGRRGAAEPGVAQAPAAAEQAAVSPHPALLKAERLLLVLAAAAAAAAACCCCTCCCTCCYTCGYRCCGSAKSDTTAIALLLCIACIAGTILSPSRRKSTSVSSSATRGG